MLRTRLISSFFLIVVVTLLFGGVLAVYSTSYTSDANHYFLKQLLWIGIGMVMALVVSLVPLDTLSRWSRWFLLAVGVALLYLALANGVNYIILKILRGSHAINLPFAPYRKGACRWIALGPISLQPAEFAKTAVLLFLASYYGMRDRIRTAQFKEGFLYPALFIMVVALLILMGRSFSNTLITCVIAGTLMFLAGAKLRYLTVAAVVAAGLGICAIMATPYRRQRMINYVLMNQQTSMVTTGKSKANNDQLEKGICALGSGGFIGLGPGKGRLKNKAIMESKTDFIFAVVGEEYGFVGVSFCITLYALFMVLCCLIAQQARDKRGMLICMGAGFYVSFQASYNLGVVCGLMPTTGVTAPFVSYGGSSIIALMLCVGLVFNVCRDNYRNLINKLAVEPSDIQL